MSEWIPVTEKLPEPEQEGIDFLCWSKDWGYAVECFRIKGIYQGFNWEAHLIGSDECHTHWIPLPEPPEVK